MMKTDFKLSSKMHLFIIVSSIIIAIGAAVGTICQFVANGYFNYGADWESYRSVTVSYSCVDFADKDEVKEVCEKAFADAGVSYYYSVSFGEKSGNTVGGEYTFKFNYSVKEEKLQTAVNAINAVIADKSKPTEGNTESVIQSTASTHTVDGLKGNGKARSRCYCVRYSFALHIFCGALQAYNGAWRVACGYSQSCGVRIASVAYKGACRLFYNYLCRAYGAFDRNRHMLFV